MVLGQFWAHTSHTVHRVHSIEVHSVHRLFSVCDVSAESTFQRHKSPQTGRGRGRDTNPFPRHVLVYALRTGDERAWVTAGCDSNRFSVASCRLSVQRGVVWTGSFAFGGKDPPGQRKAAWSTRLSEISCGHRTLRSSSKNPAQASLERATRPALLVSDGARAKARFICGRDITTLNRGASTPQGLKPEINSRSYGTTEVMRKSHKSRFLAGSSPLGMT